MKVLPLIVAALSTVQLAAAPQPAEVRRADPPGFHQCAISLMAIDRDQTTNVRKEPTVESSVEGRYEAETAEVQATGMAGNWVRISRAHDADSDMDMFIGDGWVHRSLLGLSVAGGEPNYLFEEPDLASKRIQALVADGNMLELLDCQGEWVKVKVDGKNVGWMALAAQCSNPLTTCS